MADSSSQCAPQSIDELDAAILALARHVDAATYRLLLLVREFDDRFGCAKWGFSSCAEWLAWRCGISLSAAREKVRTAHGLRRLPQISRAFAEGRLSYSKGRALTRVAAPENEAGLLAYALDATAAQIEERCRDMRNAADESTEAARRAWAHRSLAISRNAASGTMRITVELPMRGRPLDVGRKQRVVPPHMRRALLARDRSCRFPGCGRKRFVAAHHHKHWADGGETSLENTLLLCTHHHQLVHEGRYRITMDENGDLYFERRDGRVIPRCGYRADDAQPDPVFLEGTSAEGWLAALLKRRSSEPVRDSF